MRDISFAGKISYEDYKKYNSYHFKRRYTIIFIILFFTYSLIFIGVMFNLLTNTYKFIIIAMVSLILSLLTTSILILIRNKRIKTVYNSSPRIKTECTYKTIFKGIMIKSENGSRLVKWKDIIRVIEKNDIIILYTSPVKALIIARGYFYSSQDFFDFKNILKEKVKK